MNSLRALVAEALYAVADRLDPPAEQIWPEYDPAEPQASYFVRLRHGRSDPLPDVTPCGQPWDGVCPERTGYCCAEDDA